MLEVEELKYRYSNEQVLLVLMARLYFSTTTPAALSDFIEKHPVDWQLFYKIIRVHGMRPFTYYVIDKYHIKTDPSFENILRDGYKVTLMQNMKKARVTAKLVNELKSIGITVIPYKGAVLAHSYYETIALREISDIDLMVSKDDVANVEDYFISEGYAAKETVPRPYLGFYKKFFKEIVYAVPIDSDQNNVSVEVHWKLINPFLGKFPEYSSFKGHLEPCVIGDSHLHKLQPGYDLAAIVSNHFVKDLFIKFKYMTDVACFLQKNPDLPDDHLIFALAKQYHFTKRLKVGLSLVNDLLGIPSNPKYTSTKLHKHYLNTPVQYPIVKLQFNDIRFLKGSLALQDNLWQQGKCVARHFFYTFIPTHIDINTFALPVYFLPILAVLRPFRLLFEVILRKSKPK